MHLLSVPERVVRAVAEAVLCPFSLPRRTPPRACCTLVIMLHQCPPGARSEATVSNAAVICAGASTSPTTWVHF